MGLIWTRTVGMILHRVQESNINVFDLTADNCDIYSGYHFKLA